jgi:hypothetical protein
MFRLNGASVTILFGIAGFGSALAQQDRSVALKEIRETAAEICYVVQQRGRKTDSQLTGEVNAKVTGVFGRLLSGGAGISGETGSMEYEGVAQEALGAALTASVTCRERVASKLIDIFFQPVPVPNPVPPFPDKRIPPPPPPNTFARDPISGTYRGQMHYLFLVAGGNKNFAQDITLTIDPPTGRSFRGTLIEVGKSQTLAVQGQFSGSNIEFQAVIADPGGGRLEVTFMGVLTGPGSMRGNFRIRGNLWQQALDQIRAENGVAVDVVPSSFELRQ